MIDGHDRWIDTYQVQHIRTPSFHLGQVRPSLVLQRILAIIFASTARHSKWLTKRQINIEVSLEYEFRFKTPLSLVVIYFAHFKSGSYASWAAVTKNAKYSTVSYSTYIRLKRETRRNSTQTNVKSSLL